MAENSAFFDAVRTTVFGGSLTPSQVSGINNIDDAWHRYGDGNRQREAYVLATAYHETAATMQPIFERGGRTYFDKYEPGTAIGKRLGNAIKGDGYKFRGRGLVQITGRRNYKFAGDQFGIDLVSSPDRALEPVLAGRILVIGSMRGWFTGRGLNNYIDDVDEGDDEELREFVSARRVINGVDKAELIGGVAIKFEAALGGAISHAA